MTAEEFFKEKGCRVFSNGEVRDITLSEIVEFVEIHVKLALEAASKAARIIDDPDSYTGNTGSEYPPDQIVDRESILNAYPKENIK